MISKLFYVAAAVFVVLCVLALPGVAAIGGPWVGYLIAALVCAGAGFVLAGRLP